MLYCMDYAYKLNTVYMYVRTPTQSYEGLSLATSKLGTQMFLQRYHVVQQRQHATYAS